MGLQNGEGVNGRTRSEEAVTEVPQIQCSSTYASLGAYSCTR